MTKVNSTLGSLIKDRRIQLDITQEELSQKLGYLAPQFISNIERGISKIPLIVLGQLIVHLQLSEKKIIKVLLAEYEIELRLQLQEGKKQAQLRSHN